MATQSAKSPALWVPGDWNAFFGFGTNILVNMLVLTGLLRYVLKLPDSLVFGRVLPALGLMMFLAPSITHGWPTGSPGARGGVMCARCRPA
jgi:AGZA family xanthine/uracil permease-like MFS transporter